MSRAMRCLACEACRGVSRRRRLGRSWGGGARRPVRRAWASRPRGADSGLAWVGRPRVSTAGLARRRPVRQGGQTGGDAGSGSAGRNSRRGLGLVRQAEAVRGLGAAQVRSGEKAGGRGRAHRFGGTGKPPRRYPGSPGRSLDEGSGRTGRSKAVRRLGGRAPTRVDRVIPGERDRARGRRPAAGRGGPDQPRRGAGPAERSRRRARAGPEKISGLRSTCLPPGAQVGSAPDRLGWAGLGRQAQVEPGCSAAPAGAQDGSPG